MKKPRSTPKPHLSSVAERMAFGKKLREATPREAHAEWKASAKRPDPITLLKRSSKGRLEQLIPIRYGRMLQTPFTFYRGAALNMADDLSHTPVSGPFVQACGDCHLLNFGAFATPERRVIFDINDMDETLPAPWEWDVKRLSTSFVLASRSNGLSNAEAKRSAEACVRAYRKAMLEFATMRTLEVWYASFDVEKAIAESKNSIARTRLRKRLEKARERSVLEHDYPELVEHDGTKATIKDNPPLIFHMSHKNQQEFESVLKKGFAMYRNSLPEHRRTLLDRYAMVDIAIKVVGVGSVGTRCGIMLMMAGNTDPLFLQIKEARTSVLEGYAGKSTYANNGRRIVVGSQLLQSASDVFLGWTEGRESRHFYVRQLRDVKIKPLVESFDKDFMLEYAGYCGWTLARAHARSGDSAVMAGYMGKTNKFDKAVAQFSLLYADQSERDHASLMQAVRAGKLEVNTENL